MKNKCGNVEWLFCAFSPWSGLTDACVATQDYYSHTVFEFVEKLSFDEDDEDANQGDAGSGGIAVLAGGCYDNLSETLGGPSVSCIGWAAGVDRLHLLRETAVERSNTIAVCKRRIALCTYFDLGWSSNSCGSFRSFRCLSARTKMPCFTSLCG